MKSQDFKLPHPTAPFLRGTSLGRLLLRQVGVVTRVWGAGMWGIMRCQRSETCPPQSVPKTLQQAILCGILQGGEKQQEASLLPQPQCREVLGKVEGRPHLLSLPL